MVVLQSDIGVVQPTDKTGDNTYGGQLVLDSLKQGEQVEIAIIGGIFNAAQQLVQKVQYSVWNMALGIWKKSGSGYISKSAFDALSSSTYTIPATFAGLESQMVPTRLENQLFRIVEVVQDEDCVTITARHVWYDNLENYTLWKPNETTKYACGDVCRSILNEAISPANMRIATDCKTQIVGKDLDYERKNLVEAFLDPEKGVCAKFGLSLIRNNWDCYALKNVGYDRGIVIQNGKNLLGVERTESIENLATRIVPIGKTSNGEIYWLNYNGQKYINSPHINEYSYPRVEIYDTGLQSGKDDVTDANMQQKLLEAAQKHLNEDKVDLPKVEMKIEFLSLGDTEEYAQYRNLDKVYLYDILTVRDTVRGYSYTAQVIAVEHDILTGQLLSVTIGDLKNWDGTRKIATWQVPEVNGENIRLKSIMAGAYGEGSIDADAIGAGAIQYVHLNSATIDELTSTTINAIQANIQELVAGHITADSIDTNEINAINAKLGTAQIADAQIQKANIEQLIAGHITAESIKTQEIDAIAAKIGVARIADARIQTADIDYSHIKDLAVDQAIIETSITEQGIANKLFISRLMISYGQMVQATIGDLVLGASNGNYYHVDVAWDENGVPMLVPTQVQVSASEIAEGNTTDGKTIIGDVGTYEDLSTTNFYSINGIIDRITAKRIDVDQLFAREATIKNLNTVNISNNQYISIAVREQMGQGKQYYQEDQPASGEVGDMWFQPVYDELSKKWQELESSKWQDEEGNTWGDLSHETYKTYRYDGAGWQLIDGYTSAQIVLVNDAILAEVQRATAAEGNLIAKTTVLQTADDIVLSAKTAAATTVATQFFNNQNYAVGDYVSYEGVVYKFTSAHPAGAWTGTDVVPSNANIFTQDYSSSLGVTAMGIDIVGSKHINLDIPTAVNPTSYVHMTDNGIDVKGTNSHVNLDVSSSDYVHITNDGVDVKGTGNHINLDIDSNNYVRLSGDGIKMKGVRATIEDATTGEISPLWGRDDIIVMKPNATGTSAWRATVADIEAHQKVGQTGAKHDWVLIKPYYDASIPYTGSTGNGNSDAVIINSFTQSVTPERAFGNNSEWYQYQIVIGAYNVSGTAYTTRTVKVFLSNRPFTFVSANRESEAATQAQYILEWYGTITGNGYTWINVTSPHIGLNLCGESATVYYYVYGLGMDGNININQFNFNASTAATTSKVPCTVYYYP